MTFSAGMLGTRLDEGRKNFEILMLNKAKDGTHCSISSTDPKFMLNFLGRDT